MTIQNHRHGVVRLDCSHPDCKAAVLRCHKASQLRRLRGETALADVSPVRLHIATLRGRGWSLRAISAEAGLSPTTLSRIMSPEQSSITRDAARKVLAVDPMKIPVKGSRDTSEPFVPRIGTQRRLQALLAIGWTHRELGLRGISSRNLLHQQGHWVTRSTHDKVATVYRELCTQRGPSEKTIRWAAKLGYLSPAHWNDIDLDDAPEVDEPETEIAWEDSVDEAMVDRIVAGGPRPRRATRAEAAAAYRRLRSLGLSTYEIEERYGLKSERYAEGDEAA